MIEKMNRAIRRWMKKKDVEIIIRSESYVEVLENALGRKLEPDSAADMGLLDEFVDMNKRLDQAPQYMRQRIRKMWFEALKDITKIPSVPAQVLTDKIVIPPTIENEVN